MMVIVHNAFSEIGSQNNRTDQMISKLDVASKLLYTCSGFQKQVQSFN